MKRQCSRCGRLCPPHALLDCGDGFVLCPVCDADEGLENSLSDIGFFDSGSYMDGQARAALASSLEDWARGFSAVPQ